MSDNQYHSRQQRKKKNEKKNKKTKRPILKRIVLTLLLIGITIMLAGGITVLAFIADAPKLDLDKLNNPLSSKVYDMNNNLIADLGVEKRTEVSYNEIPEIVRNAFIAVEDVRFYDHMGVDIKRIFGAALANIREGFGAEGASTITQQVVKNYFLSPEKSIKRKVQEAVLAIKLEQKLSKEQILELYLNKIFFSQSTYGVAKAAETYFGKSLDELEIHEAALLAGMPKAPNRYNPFDNPEKAQERRNVVLSLMEQHGFITKEQAEEAQATPVQSTLVTEQKDKSPYDAFIDVVIDEVKELGDIDIHSAGLKIYTTLDPNAQAFVEKVLNTKEYIDYPNDDFQAGVVLLDTTSGEIRAIGGGRNRKIARGLNYATDDNETQPGSTIKPVIDYGPAIEYLKWSTYHQISDTKHTYSNGTPISNWDNEYWGQMSIRRALEWSRNIPALKTLQEVGLDRARDFATKLGLDLPDPIYESYAIGGFDGVSPMDLAGAYSAFGNNGIYIEPHTVTKVVFPDEREVITTPEPVVAMSDYTAFMITDMLQTVVRSGTGAQANVPGVQIAGKTGTTNFSEETKEKYNIKPGGVPDIWFAGYSPHYTMSVWTGYSKTTSENYIYGSYQHDIAKLIFKNVMAEVHKNKEKKYFKVPNSVTKVAVEKGTNPAKLASEFTPDNKIVYEYFVKGTEPTAVSEKYIKLENPFDLTALYDQEKDEIHISWSYPEEDQENILFSVRQATVNEKYVELTQTKETSFTFKRPTKGETYKFEITAFDSENPENRSDPVVVSILIPEMEDIEDPLNDINPGDDLVENPHADDDSNNEDDDSKKNDKEETDKKNDEKNNEIDPTKELENLLPGQR